jgi:hypothetical protein
VIDRAGYDDRAAALERELATATEVIPFGDPEGRRSFVDLRPLRRRLEARLGAGIRPAEESARYPVLVGWRGAFYGEERVGEERWHWAGGDGELVVYSHPREPQTVLLTMAVAAARDKPTPLRIRSPFWNETITLAGEPVAVARQLVIPPGTHRIELDTDARATTARGDARRFVFRVVGLELEPLERSAAAAGAR